MKGHRVSGLLALGILFFTFPVSMIAQQSLFESRDGDTSIFLENQGGVISANIGQSNLKLSYLHQNTAKNWGAGIDVFGELKGSTTDLFNATPPAKAAEVRAGWILQHLLTDHPRAAAVGPKSGETQECRLCDDWIAVQVGYQRSQIHLIDTSISPLAAPTGHGFDGYLARFAYNQVIKLPKHDFLLGAVFGVSRTNNTDDLDSVQVTDTTVSTDGTVERRAAKDAVSAYVGTYVKYIAVPINADAIWYPGALSGRIGLDLFVRSNVAATKRSASPGIGIFYCKAGQPARPIGGLTASYKDGKGKVALVAGWNF
jgi:hypothetical protein